MSFVSHVLFLQSQNVGCEKDLILQYIFKEVESYFELLDAKVQFIACSLKLSILLISFHFLYIFFSYFLCNCVVSLNLYAFTSKNANAAVGIKAQILVVCNESSIFFTSSINGINWS